MQLLEAIILGIIQGLTEFLPVSSSGHLLLLPELSESLGLGLDFSFQNTRFDVALHIATFIVLLAFYHHKIWRYWQQHNSAAARRQFLLNITLTSIPSLVLGGILYVTGMDEQSKYVAVVFLIVIGALLVAVEFFPTGVKKFSELSGKSALIIGLFQAVALIRGSSRSGMTIIGGLANGLKREEAFDYAFIASIPLFGILTLVAILEMLRDTEASVNGSAGELLAGFISALVTGVIALYLFRRFISYRGFFAVMGIYRILVGMILLALFLA